MRNLISSYNRLMLFFAETCEDDPGKALFFRVSSRVAMKKKHENIKDIDKTASFA